MFAGWQFSVIPECFGRGIKATLNHMTSDKMILMQGFSNQGNFKSHDFR